MHVTIPQLVMVDAICKEVTVTVGLSRLPAVAKLVEVLAREAPRAVAGIDGERHSTRRRAGRDL